VLYVSLYYTVSRLSVYSFVCLCGEHIRVYFLQCIPKHILYLNFFSLLDR